MLFRKKKKKKWYIADHRMVHTSICYAISRLPVGTWNPTLTAACVCICGALVA